MNGTNLYLGKRIPNQSMAIIRRWNQSRGETKGSFFVPEDSKTVVTASGKVIETDTEAIQKKLEQKREERKALPVEELTVPEQIERKEEEEKKIQKEYIFPAIDTFKRGTWDRPISRIRSTGRQRSSCSRRSRTSAWA